MTMLFYYMAHVCTIISICLNLLFNCIPVVSRGETVCVGAREAGKVREKAGDCSRTSRLVEDTHTHSHTHPHTPTHSHTHTGNLIRKREEQNRLELECLLSLKRWGEAVALLTSILQENPDHWRHIEVYISCQIQRYKDSVREAREDHERERREGGVAGREEVWEGEGEKEEEEVNLVNTTAGGSERQIPRSVGHFR